MIRALKITGNVVGFILSLVLSLFIWVMCYAVSPILFWIVFGIETALAGASLLFIVIFLAIRAAAAADQNSQEGVKS